MIFFKLCTFYAATALFCNGSSQCKLVSLLGAALVAAALLCGVSVWFEFSSVICDIYMYVEAVEGIKQ